MIAVIKRCLSREQNPAEGYLQAVARYNGEIDQAEGPEDIRRFLRGRSPVVLITASGAAFNPESSTRRRFMRRISIELLVASNHQRNRESRLASDVVSEQDPTADPGIFLIAEDIQQILSGNDLGLDGVSPIDPVREDVLLQMDDFTAWRLTYDTKTDAHVKPHSFGDRKFLTYQIDGNLVDFDGETVLPSPPNPFAEADGDLT